MSEPASFTLFVENRTTALAELPALLAQTGVATAFVSTPDKFHVARVDRDALFVADGTQQKPLDPTLLAGAYEVRAFGPHAEVRWTRDGRSGRATVLSEDGEGEKHDCIDRLERNYFLWGGDAADNVDRPDGWSAVSAGRVGAVLVPATASGEGRLRLQAFEYVKKGAHGNAFVLAERYGAFVRKSDRQPADERRGDDA